MLTLPDFRYKQVIVHIAGGSGECIRFRADNLIVEDRDGKVLLQHSCHRLFALFIVGNASLTSGILQKSAEFAFPIVLMNRNLRVVTRINSAADGNTLLRARQYSADCPRLEIAKRLVAQKIANQTALLQDLRYRADEDNAAIDFIRSIPVSAAADPRELMGMEGLASRAFFSAYFRQLGWCRREPRCKRDPANLLLDIGYTYLFNFIEAMLGIYGFDVYCGVLHTLFYHRKSLVCDIVEPFRCIIDRRLRKAHNLGQICADDFELRQGAYVLRWKNQEKYTRLFLKDILERKEDIFRFCQKYYRRFAQGKILEDFPIFKI